MDEPTRSLALLAATLALIMAALWLAFDTLLERRYNPNRHIESGASGPQRVELEPNPAGQYVLPGRINGVRVTFLLDTGASHVAVPARLADDLGLERGPEIRVDTAGGRTSAYHTIIERIAVGGIVQHGVRGSINPALSSEHVLLGMTFLRHVDFRREGERLIIERPQ